MINLRKRFITTRFRQNDSGLAAVEFGLIFPILVFLFFGLIDLTGYISSYRKATLAASIVADLVGQNKNTVTTTALNDYFLAAYMVTNYGSTDDGNVKVNVSVYRKDSTGTIGQIWTHSGGTGTAVCAAPSTTGLATLMTGTKDVIVAQVCTHFKAYVGFALSNYNVSDAIYVVPRLSDKIDKS